MKINLKLKPIKGFYVKKGKYLGRDISKIDLHSVSIDIPMARAERIFNLENVCKYLHSGAHSNEVEIKLISKTRLLTKSIQEYYIYEIEMVE